MVVGRLKVTGSNAMPHSGRSRPGLPDFRVHRAGVFGGITPARSGGS